MTRNLSALWRPFVGAFCGSCLGVAVFVKDVSEGKLVVLAGFVGALAGLRSHDKRIKGAPSDV